MPAPLPPNYSEQIRRLLAEGKGEEALRLAAGWKTLGEHKARITRGYEALRRPDFQRQLGKDPAKLVEDGIAALRERYEPTFQKTEPGAAKSRKKRQPFAS